MFNRRNILSTLLGTVTTPALIAPQPKSTGEQKKYIMVVLDSSRVSNASAQRLANALRGDGFHGPIVRVSNAPEPIRVIDLSNLPEADLEEVKRVCSEVAK